ncbi:MAG TPA: cytochrome b/b6 domain-containing protein [Burkholderiaceae bacterium]|nr:cytochrome b/b6 domain-containing protein [Burkholderiaceae bacterium]
MNEDSAATPTVRVWDRPVRVLHWLLVGSVALSALGLVALFGVHQPAGYVALGAVFVRVTWGVVGGRYARFAQFVRGPRATLRYARAAALGRAPRFVGHNPLGGWMIVALMACIAALALTGWLYTTDAFWGDATVESLHRALAWALLALVVLHVAGVIATGLKQRENLVESMWTGRKRAPSGDDID